MRIKRIAFTGTFFLVVGCLGLYLLLDYTLSADHRSDLFQNNNVPSYASKIAEKSIMLFNQTFRRNYVNVENRQDVSISKTCTAIHPFPKVDIQMSNVYDIIKFDNIDGGPWKQGWNVVYNEKQWNENNKLKIFVVPHSHNDPGWKKTFEEYYKSQTRSILNNLVKKLREDERRKFIWAEISFFSLWWSEISEETKDQVKELLKKGQLEIVTGGWVMPDEANSHYYSLFEQLLHGHQWLQNNLNYIPRYSWSIDPFGLSPSLPFLLKKSKFKGLAVQRSHYSVKKYLAKNKLLEFRWRQLWDSEGSTELFTHMMPFYSYDVPHTCGPDPKICCQFDFKRLPGHGVTCPWKVPPQHITDQNVAQKAAVILDQYRKKAQLYSTNVVLVPLGDDFRYDHVTEWDAQYTNYQKLFDFINNNQFMNAQAQFGTLSDYFEAVQAEKAENTFPSLTGDFFTYADRDDHYWSGYYTSRPYYKRMDRVLASYLRSAEVLLNMAIRLKVEGAGSWGEKLAKRLEEARGAHSLFQHHDGITGTAKDHVVTDYANKMLEAIKTSQHVIQQSANFLLSNGKESQSGEESYFRVDDHQRLSPSLGGQQVLKFPTGIPARHVTFFNPLTIHRSEIVSLRVENSLVQVKNSENEVLDYQISPVCGESEGGLPERSCYCLSFVVDIGPLSLRTYSIEPIAEQKRENHVTVRMFNANWAAHKYEDWSDREVEGEREFSIENNKFSVAFNKMGLLKAVTIKGEDNSVTVPIHLSFIRYSARLGPERSGAYLFLPEGEAETMSVTEPRVTVEEGKLVSRVTVHLQHVEHSVIIHNTPGADNEAVEIHNLVDLVSVHDNYELGMRFSSNIKNGDVFYTDLNGIQIIKRKRLKKLPLQANYYPLPSCGYIEDENIRLTVLSGQPLGVAALRQGQIEIMQDRKLFQDDNRGLDQGVADNKPTLSIFRLAVELKTPNCQDGEFSTWGRLSWKSWEGLESLLHPIERLVWEGDPRAPPPPTRSPLPAPAPQPAHTNIHLVTTYTINATASGIVLHATNFDSCVPPIPHHSSQVNLSSIVPMYAGEETHWSSLTFTDIGDQFDSASPQTICDMDILAYYIKH